VLAQLHFYKIAVQKFLQKIENQCFKNKIAVKYESNSLFFFPVSEKKLHLALKIKNKPMARDKIHQAVRRALEKED
jgi:hypothetical protein